MQIWQQIQIRMDGAPDVIAKCIAIHKLNKGKFSICKGVYQSIREYQRQTEYQWRYTITTITTAIPLIQYQMVVGLKNHLRKKIAENRTIPVSYTSGKSAS